MTPEEFLQRRRKVYRELGIDFEGDELVSLYHLLGLPIGASDSKTISKAYRKQAKVLLAKKARKDRPVVDALQAEIEHAFAVLKDDERRERYDGFLALELERSKRAGLRLAVEAVLEEQRCSPEAYQRLLNLEKRLELGEDNGSPWLEAYFKEQGITIAAGEPARAPEPARPAAAQDWLAPLLAFCVAHKRVAHVDFQRLIKAGQRAGLSEAAARARILEEGRLAGLTIEAKPPSGPLPVAAEPKAAPRGVVDINELKVPARKVGPLPEKAHEVYERALRRMRRGTSAHQDLRAYVPVRGQALLESINGRHYSEVFQEEAGCYTVATAMLHEALELCAGSDALDAFRPHAERIIALLQDYLKEADALDRDLQARPPTEHLALWRRFVYGRRLAAPTEALPEGLAPKATPEKRVKAPRRILESGAYARPSQRVIPLGKVDEPAASSPSLLPPPARVKLRAEEVANTRKRTDDSVGARRRTGEDLRKSSGPLPRAGERPGSERRPAVESKSGENRRRSTTTTRMRAASGPLRRRTGLLSSERMAGASTSTLRRRSTMKRLRPVPHGKNRFLAGIDLGAVCSIAVFDKNGRPRLIPNLNREDGTPAALLFNEYSLLVGRSAQESMPALPSLRVTDYLHHMASDLWRHRVHRRAYPAEALVALLIARLLRDVVAAGRDAVTDVVIAVPGSLTPRQRSALYLAGKMARVNVIDVIDAAAAAGFCQAFDLADTEPGSRLNLHVGGDSLDAAILDRGVSSLKVRALTSDRAIGCRRWNDAIAREVCARFLEIEGVDPAADPLRRYEIEVKTWEALSELGVTEPARVLVECLERIQVVKVEPDRLKTLALPYVQGARRLIQELLGRAGLAPEDLVGLRVSGEPGFAPAIDLALRDAFGDRVAPLERRARLAAHGALFWGAQLLWSTAQRPSSQPFEDLRSPGPLDRILPIPAQAQLELLTLKRTCSEGLGVLVESSSGPRRIELLEPGAAIPGSTSRMVRVTGPAISATEVLPRRGSDIIIAILGGEADEPGRWEQLTEIAIEDPHSIRSQLRIDIRMMDHDGGFIIDVVDPMTEELLLSRDIEGERRRGLMGEALVERWRKDLQSLHERGPSALEPLG